MSHPQWQTIRDRKLADVASRIPTEWQIPASKLPPASISNVLSIPHTCGILTSKELHITESYNARSLLSALRNRDLTAVEVTTAFCKRAAVTHQLTNCLTEPLFHPALARAKHLDAHLARTGTPLGPLHGLPTSIKDTFHISGTDSTLGIASLCNRPVPTNAPLVDLLLSAGAIIHCKTNLPQTALAIDSVNNIYGRVLNPQHRQQWTAGGSSGGEGVLVKMRGCVMGVGTDVGGSVRIPALCNGIVGFKPSDGRIPRGGQETGQLPAGGKVGLESAVGVIARELGDVDVFFGAVEGGRAWEVDQEIVPGRWWSGGDPYEGMGKIKAIGVIWRDGIAELLPPVRQVMSEVVQKLKSRGSKVIDIDAKRFKDCQTLANKFFSAEGGHHLLSLIEQTGEPLIPWLRSRIKRKQPISLDSWRDLLAQRAELQHDWLAYWKGPDGEDIDAMICPVAPHPVPPIDKWNTMSYTSSFVLLDYPAASLPVRNIKREDLEEEMTAEVLGPWDKVDRELWNDPTTRNGFLGSPLGVQVLAPRLQERRLFDAIEVIEDALRGEQKEERARL